MSYPKRVIYLRTEQQRETLINAARNLPLDADKPLQITIEEYRPARKLDQNALMWAGPLKDIAEQAFVDGRQFKAEIWHEMLKREFLPEQLDPELCRDGYVKWALDMRGDRVLLGSTTQLTVRGMALYLQQVEAFGANLGVMFYERQQNAQ